MDRADLKERLHKLKKEICADLDNKNVDELMNIGLQVSNFQLLIEEEVLARLNFEAHRCPPKEKGAKDLG